MAEAGSFTGKRLREWLAIKGMTQTELCKITGFDPSYVSKVANDKAGPIELKNWRKFAAALKIEPYQLSNVGLPPKDRDVEEMLSRLLPAEDVRQVMRQIRLYQEEHRRRHK